MVTQALSGKMILAVSCVTKPSSLSNAVRNTEKSETFMVTTACSNHSSARWEGVEWMSSKPQAFTTKQNDSLCCLLTELAVQHPAGGF